MNLEHEPPLHRVTTPEGVDLHFPIASVADRILAFTYDMLVLAALWLAVWLMVAAVSLIGPAVVTMAVLVVFLSWTFYFPFFELRWNGATPGKRRLKLRVIRADGGPLTPEAILARNFLRTVELQVPAMFLFAPEALFPGHSGWLRLLGGGWVLAMLLLPLCSKARLRAGDFVGGTRVVVAPEARLLPELVQRPRPAADRGGAAPQPPRCTFAREQLEIYGIYELQVLEEVLRKMESPGGGEAIAVVAERIQQKIGFDPRSQPLLTPRVFLQEFYAAQRAHLEQQLLFGKRRERKQDPRAGRDPGRR